MSSCVQVGLIGTSLAGDSHLFSPGDIFLTRMISQWEAAAKSQFVSPPTLTQCPPVNVQSEVEIKVMQGLKRIVSGYVHFRQLHRFCTPDWHPHGTHGARVTHFSPIFPLHPSADSTTSGR